MFDRTHFPMKNFIGIFSFLLFSLSVHSQILEFSWSTQFMGPNNETIAVLEHDVFGNIFSGGSFTDSIDLDPTIGFDFNYSVGNNDFFVCKQDSSGGLIWSNTFGGLSNEFISDIESDAYGNIYVTGTFSSSTVDFDPSPNVFNLSHIPLSSNYFVLKLDSAGNFLWVKQFLNTGYPNIEVDNITNGFYLYGTISDTVDFDPSAGVSQLFPVTGQNSSYISKYDNSGNLIWAKNFNGTLRNNCNDIAIDTVGSIYLKGNFNLSVDFDPGPQIYQLTTSVGGTSYEGYVVKLTSSGNFIWAKQISGNDDGYYEEITVDVQGNCHIVGATGTNSIDLDPGPATNIISLPGIFACKWDSSGNFIWGGQVVSDNIHFHSSSLDESGNLYIAGDFGDTTDFDPSPSSLIATNDSSSFDLYITKWDSAGNFDWLYHSKKGTGDEHLFDLEVVSENEIVAGGMFSGAGYLDSGSTTPTHISMAGQDPYIFKLKACSMVSYNSYNDTSCSSYISPSGSYTWNSSGIYTDTVYNYCGGDSILTINLTIPVIDTSVNINNGILSSNMVNSNYQWIDCNNNYALISGQNGQNFSPTLTGSYAVIITENGCQDTSSCLPFTMTNIDDYENNLGISVYPNPTKKDVFIKFNKILNKNYEIHVSDLVGRTILVRDKIQSNSINLNSSELGKGVFLLYLVDMATGEKNFIEKVIVY